jgi:uncharacterized RDD family membrane protein YckC
MAHDVFISYAKEDRTIADRVCAELEANGIICWIAPRDIPPAEKYAPALIRAIDTCNLFLLIFSSSSNASPHVMTEVERAFNKKKTILSFRVEDLEPNEELGFFIGGRQWLDAYALSYDMYLPILVQSIRSKCCPTREKKKETIDIPRPVASQDKGKMRIDAQDYRAPLLLLRRLVAYVIDCFFGFLLACGFLIVAIAILTAMGNNGNDASYSAFTAAWFVFGFILYFFLYESYFRKPSIGKKVERVRIVDQGIGMSARWKWIIRALVKTIPYIIWPILSVLKTSPDNIILIVFLMQLIIAIPVLITPKGQALHDILAGTVVLEA